MSSRSEGGIDEVGWRILDTLQAEARLSFSELGRRVGLSAPAVAERVRRLEDAGVIGGYRAVIACEKLFAIIAIVRVSAPEHQCVALGECVRALSEVVESYRVTGDDRLVLKVVAKSVAHLDWVMAQLGRFGTPTASVVLRSRSRAVSAVVDRGAPGDARGRRASTASSR